MDNLAYKEKELGKYESDGSRKLTLIEKLSYGCGDLGGNFSWGAVMGVITFFYTDYCGVAAATVGLILLLSRFLDGISDFIFGFILEKTHTPKGKCRPWIFRTMWPMAILTVLMFTVPSNATNVFKVIYIFIIYNLLNTVCFTANNLSYSALSARMTRNVKDRAEVASFRLGMAPIGRIIVTAGTLPLVSLLGNNQKAWIIVMAVWAAISLIPLWLCYHNCIEYAGMEVDKIQAKMEPIKLKSGVLHMITNPAWWGVTLLWGFSTANYSITGAMVPYYCKYLFGNQNLYSVLNLLEAVCFISAAFISGQLQKKMAKSHIGFYGCLIGCAAQIVIFLNPLNFGLIVAMYVIRSFFTGLTIPCVFALIGDAAEYQQFKTHKREEGLVFSASGIGSKVGSGLAAGLTGLAMSAAGYIASAGASVVQPESVLTAIPRIYTVAELLVWGVQAVIFLLWFRLDAKLPSIMDELHKREARGEF